MKLGDNSKIPGVLGTRGKIFLSVGLVALGLLVLVLSLKAYLAPVAPKVVAEAEAPTSFLAQWWWAIILLIGVAIGAFLTRGTLVADFVARSWPAWVALALACVWNVSGGGHFGAWKYFFQMLWVLSVATGLGAFYAIWSMDRAKDEYEYEEVGTGAFTGFALLLALWSILLGPPSAG